MAIAPPPLPQTALNVVVALADTAHILPTLPPLHLPIRRLGAAATLFEPAAALRVEVQSQDGREPAHL